MIMATPSFQRKGLKSYWVFLGRWEGLLNTDLLNINVGFPPKGITKFYLHYEVAPLFYLFIFAFTETFPN